MKPDAFDLDIPPAPISGPSDDPDRPGVGRSAWRGTMAGLRWAAYIAGPIAALGLLSEGWPKAPVALADAVDRLHQGPANRKLDDATADRLRASPRPTP